MQDRSVPRQVCRFACGVGLIGLMTLVPRPADAGRLSPHGAIPILAQDSAAAQDEEKDDDTWVTALRTEIAFIKETVANGGSAQVTGPRGQFMLTARSLTPGGIAAGGIPLFEVSGDSPTILEFEMPKPASAEELGIVVKDNMVVREVQPDSLAALIGVRVGDLVGELNGESLLTREAFDEALESALSGDSARLVIAIYRR